MQSSAYNNPLFSQGLAQLVQGFIGNPNATAQNEEAASRALLNNQTAQYREAIGETGLGGDLASMMVRALQAGPEYSGNAPGIGQAAINMGALGFGSENLTPDAGVTSMIRQGMMPRSGRTSSGTRQFDPEIAAQASAAIAAGANPDRVYERATELQRLRDSGIQVTQ